MVFLAGPRQVGKTTFAKQIMSRFDFAQYFLWDKADHRKAIMRAQWPVESSLIVLDELHKYRKWKGWLKGEFDLHREKYQFLVTGSARMDVYRKGGDSLQGRYHHYRMHPFTLNEIQGFEPQIQPGKELIFRDSRKTGDLSAFMEFGGFPEPLFAASARSHRRWQKERFERFFREDIRDLENVRELSQLQLLADLLPEKVGNPLSLNSLREDLEVSHRAVTNWVQIFERLYFVFRVPPFHVKKLNTFKKETKAYLYDWTQVVDRGKRYENLIASHLLKFCNFLDDRDGYNVQLYYLRDPEKREVDFLITYQNKPWFAVEAKVTDEKIAPSLRYFQRRLSVPYCFQVVLGTKRDFMQDEIRVIPAEKFLTAFV